MNEWNEVDNYPYKPGRYLVIQETEDRKRYRWIRYWDGKAWCNVNMEKYGEVTHWMVLPDWP